MAKILISSIGTGIKKEGGYKKAIYEYDGKTKETPFISKALSEFLEIDKLFLIGTNGSIWDSVYSEFGGDEEIELELYSKIVDKKLSIDDLKIVEKQIDTFLKTDGSKCFLIEYGVNEDELWDNFSIFLGILNNFDDGDEVYLDITHSFRSLALMSFLMAQFGHTIKKKKFKIAGILYGMFEYSWENNGNTPIVDLKIFFELVEWMKAVENFTQYGNADKIIELIDNKKEQNLFENLSTSLSMSNLAAIKDNVNTISTKIKLILNSNNKVVKLLSDELIEFVNRLNKTKHSDFQLALSEWFCEHKHYALGYLALIEAIVSKVCEVKGYDVTNKDDRDLAKKEISTIDKDLYYKVYKSANEIRNDIAHQIGKRKNSLIQDAIALKSYISKTKKIFSKIQNQGKI